MRVGRAALSGKLLGGSLAAAVLGSTMSACGGSASTASASTVSCTNYAIHGSGKYHDEVWVQVSVSNTSSKPVNYVVDVNLTAADPKGSGTPTTPITITGMVTANSSTELSRKVLTVSQIQHCEITRLSQS
jgi:hypothetical protein